MFISCPFPASDSLVTFSGKAPCKIPGTHPGVSDAMKDIYTPFGNDIFDIKEDEKDFEDLNLMEFQMMLQDIRTNDLEKKFFNANVRYLNKKQNKWEKNLEDYDLLAMASLAQSLIDLTGFHRILTFSEEGVGGPVDLAAITKNEGFT